MKYVLGQNSEGFTLVEIVLACVIFPIVVIGVANAYETVRLSYAKARQLNEVYAVLSACPEIDRALEYDSVSSATNCYPNNSFLAENDISSTITYAPQLTVTPTSSLVSTDPLRSANDSKAIDIEVSFPNNPAPPFKLRMLITRNGIGQL
jgi:hypothetical protein